MQTDLTRTRAAAAEDAPALAALHASAWRYAYRGVIPGVALEQMIARRDAAWWARLDRKGERALLLEFERRIVGYARLGPNRAPTAARTGEIFELYLAPEFHGVGLGKRLFDAARLALRDEGFAEFAIWALAENTLACRFYQAMGGRERWRSHQHIGGARLEMVGYHWA